MIAADKMALEVFISTHEFLSPRNRRPKNNLEASHTPFVWDQTLIRALSDDEAALVTFYNGMSSLIGRYSVRVTRLMKKQML